MAPTVVVPYVSGMLAPATVRVIKGCGYHYRFAQLDPLDEGAYGRLIRRLWEAGTDTVIVEHDVVPTFHQLTEICDCGHDWCGFNYAGDLYPDGPMFGCVRLSRRLMCRHPHAAEVALITGKRKDQEVEWWRVDSMMARDLMIRGERWVAHDSRVEHLHAGAPSGPA